MPLAQTAQTAARGGVSEDPPAVGGGIIYTAIAGEPIPANRIVRLGIGKLWIAHPERPTTPEPLIGVARETATAAGQEIAVVRTGPVDGFVGLTPRAAYYLTENGMITLQRPSSGWFLRVGYAQSSTVLLVSFSPVIHLAAGA